MKKNTAVKKVVSIAVIAALTAGDFWHHRQHHSDKLPEWIAQSNRRLELNRIDVASLYPGQVKAMPAEEGAEVKTGDVSAELSSETSGSRLEEVQATEVWQQGAVGRARAAKTQMERAVTRARANVAAGRQQQRIAKMELSSTRKLLTNRLVSQSEVTKRQADYGCAAATVKATETTRDKAQATVVQSAVAQAGVEVAAAQAKAMVKSALFTSDNMNICAPMSGRVECKVAEVSSVVASSSKVASLLDPSDVSMNIFLPTGNISRLRVNDDARIRPDGIDAIFSAKIQFIATDVQFAPEAMETIDGRARLMFKVKLRIPRETAAKYNRLFKGGMVGNGFVRTDGKTAWPSELTVKLPQQFFRRPVWEEAV